MNRRLSVRALLTTLLVFVTAALGVALIHSRQMRRNLEIELAQARRTEAAGDLEGTILYLRHYLAGRPEDAHVWAWLARVMDQRPPARGDREQVYQVYAEAARLNPDEPSIRRRAAALAMERERWQDARAYLNDLLARSADPAALAEVEDRMGQCQEALGHYRAAAQGDDADGWYGRAIAHDPARISTYRRRALMLRDKERDPAAADRVIAAMIQANPRSALAHLERWRYLRQYAPNSNHDRDLAAALKADPSDADVLIASIGMALSRSNLAEARRLAERGREIHPENPDFFMLLASVESKDQHPDRVEAILRQGVEACPDDLKLPFLLADLLLSRQDAATTDDALAAVERLRGRRADRGLLKYLEARRLMSEQRWDEAVSSLTIARTLCAAAPTLSGRLTLLLADCHGMIGNERARIAALEEAVLSQDEGVADTARLLLAGAAERAGQFDRASAEYARLVESRPEVLIDIARIAVRETALRPPATRRWQEAEKRVQDAETALRSRPADLALLRAELHLSQGQPDEARKTIESALGSHPQDRRLRLVLAAVRGSQGNWDEALGLLEKIEKELGPGLDTRIARINALAGRGGAGARKAIERIAGSERNLPRAERPRWLETLAAAWQLLGERALARGCWRELLALEPQNRRVVLTLFDQALLADDLAEARQWEVLLRSLEGDEGVMWRYAEALRLIAKARRGDPRPLDERVPALIGEIAQRRANWWGVSVLRAQVSEARDRLEDAAKAYLEAIARGNSDPDLAQRAVALLLRLERYSDIETIRQTFASRGLEPRELKLYSVVIALRRGESGRAVSLAREAVLQRSGNPFDHLLMGRVLEESGQASEAAAEFRRALELGPRLPGLWRALVHHLVRNKQVDEARRAVEAARKAISGQDAAQTLAECYLLVGDPAESDRQVELMLQVRPRRPELLQLAVELCLKRLPERGPRAEQLIAELLEPSTKASLEETAWARRALARLRLQPGSRGGFDQAIGLIDRNLQADPRSEDDRRAREAVLATRPDRRGDAIRELEASERNGSLEPNRRFLLAMLYLAENSRELCRGQLVKLLVKSPRNAPDHLVVMTRLDLDEGRLDDASHWLAELKQQEPASVRVLALEAGLLKARGRGGELRALLLAYTGAHGDQAGEVAELLEQHGLVNEAEAAFRKSAADQPSNPERAIRLSEFLARRGRIQDALNLWERKRPEMDSEAAANLGAAIVSQPAATREQREQFSAWLARALEERPSSPALRLRLAYVHLKQGRDREAQELYRQVLASSPDNIEALNNLASLLAFQDEARQEALRLIHRAIAAAGPTPALLDTRAVVYLQLGDTERALTDLHQAIAASPDSPILLFHLARANDLAAKPGEARKALEQAVKLGLQSADLDLVERAEYGKLRSKLLGGC